MVESTDTVQSISPAASASVNSVARIVSQVPSPLNLRCRFHTVCHGPNSAGSRTQNSLAVRVGEDHPADVRTLSHADPPGTELLQAADFSSLVLRTSVEVQSILASLLLGHAQEQQVGNDAVVPAACRRHENHLLGLVVGAAPTEC